MPIQVNGLQAASQYIASTPKSAPAIEAPESLVEQLMPEAEAALEAGAAVEEEPAAEVELSKELNQLNAEMERMEMELENARKQGEAMQEGFDDMGKVMAIFRRIAAGDRVPAQDEQKLMQYSAELYSAAKQMGAAAQNEDPTQHKSVDDEAEQAAKIAEQAEALAAGGAPEIAIAEGAIDVGE